MRRLLCATLVVTACGRGGPAKPPATLADSLGAITRAFADSNHVPGLAVGIWRGDSLRFAANVAVTSLGGGTPITSRTLFHMASVTKPFVATAIMQLVEQDKVRLSEPVRRYLPYFSLKEPRSRDITVLQLLRHVGGIPDVTDYRWNHAEYDDGSLERWVRGLKDSSLIATPDSISIYSNIGFEILADVVAKASGQPFEVYVQQHILTPLGMSKSTLLMTDIDSSLMAWGHSPDTLTHGFKRTADYPYNRRHAGSSTLHSNVADMLRWGRANLRGGELDGVRVLQASSRAEMWKPGWDLTAEAERDARKDKVKLTFDSLAVGYSWTIMRRRGHHFVMHSGSDVGFSTDFVLAPDDEIAIVVLLNCHRVDAHTLSVRLFDRVVAAPR